MKRRRERFAGRYERAKLTISAYQFPIGWRCPLESVPDCPTGGTGHRTRRTQTKKVSRARGSTSNSSVVRRAGCNWRGRIMECCQWAQRAKAGRGGVAWKAPNGGRGNPGKRVANGQSKVACDPKGDRTFLSRFRPLSDQECLSRLEWFIPSISGDYFMCIYIYIYIYICIYIYT